MDVSFIFLALWLLNSFYIITGHGSHSLKTPTTEMVKDEENPLRKLLVISFDGFRYDFLDRGLPNFKTIIDQGVRAKSLTASYITKTFPNHMTIVTGLYEESHGIVGNAMFDPVWNQTFKVGSNSNEGKWYGGEPVWNTNEFANVNSSLRHKRHGSMEHSSSSMIQMNMRRSGLMYWPGAGAKINNHTTVFEEEYVHNKSDPSYKNLTSRIDTILEWFQHKTTPINLGFLYYEQPDQTAHLTGPESDETLQVLKSIDGAIGYLLNQMKAKNLVDVNLMIVSDHGFMTYDADGAVYLDDCIDKNTYTLTDDHPIVMIWPKSESLSEELYKNLTRCQGLEVYKKGSDALIHYHYSNNRRISPIIVSTTRSADGSSAKQVLQSHSQTLHTKGDHGWNSTWDKMHAIFIAKGPAFKQGYLKNSFENVNLQPLMCKILELSCPVSNGSLSTVSDLLYEEWGLSGSAVVIIMLGVICITISCVFTVRSCSVYEENYSYNSRTAKVVSFSLTEHQNGSQPKSEKGERTTLLMNTDDDSS